MARFINQKTFAKDGYKLIVCRNCLRIMGETHLGEKYMKKAKCRNCKNIQFIAPPRIAIMDGKEGAFWAEPGNSCFTAFF